MKKIIWAVITFILLGFGVANAQIAAPPGADLSKYGILKEHQMTVKEIADRGLKPWVVDRRIMVYNYTHKGNRFELDWLNPGDLVAVDQIGEPVYKVSCSNRLVLVKECPVCATATPAKKPEVKPDPQTKPSPGQGNAPDKEKEVKTASATNLPGWLGSLMELARILFYFLGTVLLIALMLLVAYYVILWIIDMVRARQNRVSSNGQTVAEQQAAYEPTAPPTKQQPATPPQPKTVESVTLPTEHSANQSTLVPMSVEATYGPFDHISTEDLGDIGHSVKVYPKSGDPVYLGTFKFVTTKNAGKDGEYVTVRS